MIHDASVMAYGNADDLRKQSNRLESISSEIASIYSERTNGSEDEVRALMKDETWMNAAEAKDLGLIDTVIKKGKESDADNELKSNQLITNKNLMFTKDKDLVAKLEASQAEVSEHEALIAKREAEAVTLSEDLKVANEKLVEHEASITDLTAQLETGKAELDEAKKENEKITGELKDAADKLATFDDEVDKAAQAKVALLGHDKPLDQNSDEPEPENLTGLQRAISAHTKAKK